jgi:predicted transcriptional regulator
MTNSPDRLDRIEAVLAALAASQVEERERRVDLRRDFENEAEQRAEDRERLSRIEQLVESNARAIAANSDAIANQAAEMRASVTDLVNMITAQADQAEIDRAEFRATVQQILEMLYRCFTSNGH